VRATIAARVPQAVKTAYISNGETQLDVLMGIEAAAEDRIDAIHNHHDHHHAHGEHHDHAHDHFDSFVLSMGEVDAERLAATLRDLLERHNIYRIKGFVALPGKPMRQVLQAVGERVDQHFDRLWRAGEPRLTQLVFIGKHIDEAEFSTALQATVVAAA
jgi:cobalamin biosynthesis protein CobW